MSTLAVRLARMAARRTRLDASYTDVLAVCACGWSAGPVPIAARDTARAALDRHRADAHPRQATAATSKRRARS